MAQPAKMTIRVYKTRSTTKIVWHATYRFGRLSMVGFRHTLSNQPFPRTDTRNDFWTDVLNKVVPDLPNGGG